MDKAEAWRTGTPAQREAMWADLMCENAEHDRQVMARLAGARAPIDALRREVATGKRKPGPSSP
jgi:hypothetical protein